MWLILFLIGMLLFSTMFFLNIDAFSNAKRFCFYFQKEVCHWVDLCNYIFEMCFALCWNELTALFFAPKDNNYIKSVAIRQKNCNTNLTTAVIVGIIIKLCGLGVQTI